MRKNYFYLASSILVILLSCQKKISNDDPLPINPQPTVFVGADNGFMFCLDAKTGIKNWDFKTSGAIKTTVLLNNKIIYFGNDAGEFYAVDAINGNLIWKKQYTDAIQSSACIGNEHIYFGCNNDTLYSIDLNGNISWRYNFDGKVITSPLFYDNKIYAGGDNSDKFLCIDAITGTKIWKQQWFGGSPGKFISSPALADTTIIWGTEVGIMDSHRDTPNLHVCYYQFLPQFYYVNSSPIFYGGTIYCGASDNYIYSIEGGSKFSNMLWKYKTEGDVFSSPIIDEKFETLYIGSNDMNLYAIDHVIGKLKWKYPTAGIIKSSPAIFNEIVYFASYDNFLYAVNKYNGKLIWKYYLANSSMCSPVINDLQKGVYPSISGMSKY